MADLSIENQTCSKEEKISKKTLITLMVLSLAFYLVVSVFSIIFYADVSANQGKDFSGLGVAVFIVLLLIYGSILNLVSVGCAMSGLCVSRAKVKQGLSKLWNVFFSIMIALPIITEIIFFILITLLPK